MMTRKLLLILSLTLMTSACIVSSDTDEDEHIMRSEDNAEAAKAEREIEKTTKKFFGDYRSILKENGWSRALVDSDRRMAYNVAVACVLLNQTTHFKNYDKVMPLIADLVKLTSVRNMYVISHNNNIHNFARNFCRKHGYIYNGATNAATALKELQFSPTRDLILLDSGLNVTDSKGNKTKNLYTTNIVIDNDDAEAKAAGTAWPPLIRSDEGDHNVPIEALFAREVFIWLKKDVRTNQIPIVVMALTESTDNEIDLDTAKKIYGDKTEDFLSKPLTNLLLKDLCTNLFHDAEKSPAKDAQLEAETLVIKACKAVSDLQGKKTIFDVTKLFDSLIIAMKEPNSGNPAMRAPHVRSAVIDTIAAINCQKSLPYLMAVAANTDNVVPLRKSAIDAIGALIGLNSRKVPKGNSYKDVVTLLSSLAHEEEDDIWLPAANAFGQMDLTTKTRTQLAVDHRINKDRKE